MSFVYFAISESEKRANERRNGVKGLWTYWDGVMGVGQFKRIQANPGGRSRARNTRVPPGVAPDQDANRASAFSGASFMRPTLLSLTPRDAPLSISQRTASFALHCNMRFSFRIIRQIARNARQISVFPNSPSLRIIFNFFRVLFPYRLASCLAFALRTSPYSLN
ncbi:hypothetical protein [Paraburkholderia tropica]|uniref:hypothetical protein n=1 Tax=Paraburkholderia tropica TaxID=92647 RepID=UPI001CC611D9|nr:hypothetical protein [Paraburkholderia tropica]